MAQDVLIRSPAVVAGPRKARKPRTAAWAFLAPVVIYLIAFYAYPLYRNLDLSLRHYTVRSFVQGDAPFSGLDNYRTVVGDPAFGPASRWSSSSASAWRWPSSSPRTSNCRRRCARSSSYRGCCR
jgi:hypothetical protein